MAELPKTRMNLLCRLLGHRKHKWEMSYNLKTRKITFHCSRCQVAIREVENETLLSGEEYIGFKEIFNQVG